MLLKDDYTLQYLNAFKNDNIEKGIGIKCLLDNNFVISIDLLINHQPSRWVQRF